MRNFRPRDAWFLLLAASLACGRGNEERVPSERPQAEGPERPRVEGNVPSERQRAEGADHAAPSAPGEPASGVPADAHGDGGIFTDAASGSGLDFQHFNGMSGELYMPEMMGGGVALLDYDNDGDLDAYLVQGSMLGSGKPLFPPKLKEPLRDRLYRNDLLVRPDGSRELRFIDVTEASGLDARGYGMGLATGDYDNDGWTDLYLTRFGSNQLWRNNGNGTFSDVTARAGADDARWSVSATFVDYDRDGWLDLFVGNYLDFRLDANKACHGTAGRDYCNPRSYRPVPNKLLRNRRDGTFEDVTARSQIASEYGGALGVVAADFDGDGWADIYVANDGRPNQCWINQRDGTFRDGALLGGSALNDQGMAEASMGVDAGDFDADGDEDLFMTHLKGEKNTLYVNLGNAMFEDGSARAGLATPSVPLTGFGTGWIDYDNDGWLDLLVVNGAVTVIEEQARQKDRFPLREPDSLYRNTANGRFEDVTAAAGKALKVELVSRGAAFGDVDNDGDVDVLIGNNNGPARLLINQVGSRRQWIGLRMVGAGVSRDMLGTRVGVRLADGRTLWRRVHSDGSYASASDPRVLVGLGQSARVAAVRAQWPDGRIEEWDTPRIARWNVLRQGTGRAVK